jgi:hypothetical protein
LRVDVTKAMLHSWSIGQRGYDNMPAVRGTLVVFCAAALLCGCAGPRVEEQAPPGVNLAGSWKLDHAASDDPQKILDHMREQALKIINRQAQQPVMSVPAHPGRQGQGHGQASAQNPDSDGEAMLTQPVASGPRFDPLKYSPMAHIIKQSVDRGDFLTVRQGPGEFVLDYGGSRRTFTPGQHSVVSAEGGVGDQTSGWKGREYVIEIKGQQAPVVTEEYSLSPDGHQLVEKLHISSGELPAISMTRVYRPTNESAPQHLPTND